ncbi:farnesyl pyrophosphate synthase-like [Diabrotica virgifera virgifera]|uniref:Farnesyl pyrophosphate synthase-like n=1 Tax=Diabrotica virgifera virgifera TaxID=50390 RepID=A0ABM5JVG2_DIAVI|nr:farnesyl pyrophosphate synthase-like [Diabrotica virgifera virgifera]
MLKTILKNMCSKSTQLVWFSSQNVNKNINENSAFKTECKPVDLSFETNKMFAALPSICEEIVDEQLIYHQAYPEIRERYSNLLQYTVNIDQPRYSGKGIFFLHAYRMLEKPSILTDDNLKKACVLGWCQRMMDVSIIINDDILDVSDWRYNKPAWHSLENIGRNKAILDATFVESSVWYLLINHLKSHKFFADILKQVLMSYTITNLTQCLELTKYDVKELEKYAYSARGYGFTSPILRTALYLANIDDKDAHDFSQKISNELSYFMRCEDDFNGVFNPMSDIQKSCTDISEGKISWLAIQAYQRSSPAQKTILEQHYGKANKESVSNCYELFQELKLNEVFTKYREDFYNHIYLSVQKSMPKKLPKELYLNFLNFCMTGALRV